MFMTQGFRKRPHESQSTSQIRLWNVVELKNQKGTFKFEVQKAYDIDRPNEPTAGMS